MNNLKIATWNLKDNKFRLNKNKVKIEIIKELLNEDLDILALQNVDRKLSLRLNEDLNSMGYHIDHLKEEGMTLIGDMFGREKNPIIIKNNYMNFSDVIATDGLLVNRVYCQDKDNKFYVLNTCLYDESNVDMLSNIIDYNDVDMYGKAPMVIAGNLAFDSNSIQMAKLNKIALKDNNITSNKFTNDNRDNDYLLLSNQFVVYSYNILKDLVADDMNKPLLVKAKLK